MQHYPRDCFMQPSRSGGTLFEMGSQGYVKRPSDRAQREFQPSRNRESVSLFTESPFKTKKRRPPPPPPPVQTPNLLPKKHFNGFHRPKIKQVSFGWICNILPRNSLQRSKAFLCFLSASCDKKSGNRPSRIDSVTSVCSCSIPLVSFISCSISL